ncbi:NADH dehydrogenase [ubiquinone] 1 alpha subcomplex subunit 11 [Bagarius yarrelli]|uniref:NADH dehydrogenase [ubiquinone] 1 alpha subcomplex subunit 11 n=1 Tax=Bagarius yarrelli TaxID=175774 RepID=A0A556U5N6_BAGYA|nr:NADH dehydrogenase [ubiquinone] 1 alpha subcomplex subunit 11 [Bagarius yarrelli]
MGYWDLEEGKDCVGKTWITTKLGAVLASLGAIFGITTCLSAHVRDAPDDPMNYFLGGCASGAFLGARTHSVMTGTTTCLGLGIVAMLTKVGKKEGWRILYSSKAHVIPHFERSSSLPPSSASSRSSNSSLSGTKAMFRSVRSADADNSVISDLMHIFQSFTEGELKQIIHTLVQRKARKDAKLGKRTKRAKKGTKPCSLTDKQMTVSQLGLGYISDEIILFRYCSGKCVAGRRNYDLALAKLKGQRFLTRENMKRARHSPCCRPTEYEEITFLDNHSQYHTIQEVSALKCACV